MLMLLFGVAKWQVGHVGVSDFAKRYWPLVYIVAQSEKESSATTLLGFTVDLIKCAGGGNVNVIMADGGKAIETSMPNGWQFSRRL